MVMVSMSKPLTIKSEVELISKTFFFKKKNRSGSHAGHCSLAGNAHESQGISLSHGRPVMHAEIKLVGPTKLLIDLETT